jgi:hypothetical protein
MPGMMERNIPEKPLKEKPEERNRNDESNPKFEIRSSKRNNMQGDRI